MNWQQPVSLVIVAASALLLGLHWIRSRKRRGVHGCGSAGECPLIQIDVVRKMPDRPGAPFIASMRRPK